jgi:hypothetical protein
MSDVHCKIQTRPLARRIVLHEEASTCRTKEHVKSGHGAPKGGPTPRRTGRLIVGRKFNSTPVLHSHRRENLKYYIPTPKLGSYLWASVCLRFPLCFAILQEPLSCYLTRETAKPERNLLLLRHVLSLKFRSYCTGHISCYTSLQLTPPPPRLAESRDMKRYCLQCCVYFGILALPNSELEFDLKLFAPVKKNSSPLNCPPNKY